MPIHNFGPLKRIEDAEKEVEEGKATEIKKVELVKESKSDTVEPQIQKKESNAGKKHQQKRDERHKEVHKKEKKKITKAIHPLVHGTLEIEEEEL